MTPWVLLPVYNEAAMLGPLLDQIHGQGYRALVVDDGSSDDSASVGYGRGCEVLRLEKNGGKGLALRVGFGYLLARSGWDAVVTLDADGQHDPTEIGNLLDAHHGMGADIIVGNRMTRRGDMPWLRWMTNRATSHFVSALAGQRIPDSQCGFRSIRRRVLEDLHLLCERFDMESEMLIQAGRLGHSVASVPVRTIYDGQPSRIRVFADAMRFFYLLIRMGSDPQRLNKFRGVAQLG